MSSYHPSCFRSSSASNDVHHSAIHRDDLTVHILVLRQVQSSQAHLLLPAATHRRHMALLLHLLRWKLTFLVVVRALGCHLRGEVAWCDRVDADPSTLELGAHQLGKVDCGALGGVVGA